MTIPLTPLYSTSGTRQYERQVEKALGNGTNISVKHISFYYNNEAYIEVVANRLISAIQWMPKEIRNDAEVIFVVQSMPGLPTAHKVFISQYEYLSKQLMDKVSFGNYQLTYRSGGPSPQRWLGPDRLDSITEAATKGRKAIIACELLSIIAYTEAIQEVERDAQERAFSLGLEFVHMEYLNDSDDFIPF